MPPYPGFVGPSNPAAARVADRERSVNWYPEPIQSPAAPTPAALLPAPGFQRVASTGVVGCRGLIDVAPYVVAVYGTQVLQIASNGVSSAVGTVVLDEHPATLSYLGPLDGQVLITSGGNGYVYSLKTGVFSQVLAGVATMGAAKDARFLALDAVTGHVRVSKGHDGFDWGDPTIDAFYWQLPDTPQAMIVSNDELWLIGHMFGQVWYFGSGNSHQPFAPIPGASFNYGTRAPWSVCRAGDAVCWLAHSQDGAAQVVLAQGYQPTPISSYAVMHAISGYDSAGGTNDGEALAYQEDGHTFIAFTFPTARATWVYDREVGLWHERGRWVETDHRFDLWPPRAHCHAFGQHLVGDRESAGLYEMRADFGLDLDGGPMRRLRIAPPLWAPTRARLSVSRFEFMLDSGLGTPSGQGSNPDIRLRVSLDGETWGSARRASVGRMGQYGLRPYWVGCGSTDAIWQPEVTASDPVPYRLAQVFIDGANIQAGAAA